MSPYLEGRYREILSRTVVRIASGPNQGASGKGAGNMGLYTFQRFSRFYSNLRF